MTVALAAPMNSGSLTLGQRAKETLFHKFLENSHTDSKFASVLYSANQAGHNKRKLQSAFEVVQSMCNAPDTIVPLLTQNGYTESQAEILVTCVCSDAFDVTAADAMFGNSVASTCLCAEPARPMMSGDKRTLIRGCCSTSMEGKQRRRRSVSSWLRGVKRGH